MKKLLIGILFFSSNVFASDFFRDVKLYSNNVAIVNIYNDTTMSGMQNFTGKILNIYAKISGPCTIQNAIIVASPFIQIFDTTVTFGSGINTQEFSAMWYGASSSLGDNSTPLQMSIDACKDRFYSLYIPGRTYNYSKPLIVGVFDGSYYHQTQIKMRGDATFWDNGTGTQLHYSGDSCALGLQFNKGSVIKDLWFSGNFVPPGGTDTSYFNTTFANYTNQAASGNGEGIWIDPVGNYSQRAGSTGCQFLNLKIERFNTLIKISNGISQNGEIMLFDKIQFGNGKIGIWPSQPQEKGNIFKNIYSWGSIHTLFYMPYPQQAGNYYLDGANVAGHCIRLFNITVGGFFPSHFEKIYAENIGTVGTISTTPYGLPVSINSSVFDFIWGGTVGFQTLVSSDHNSLKFNSCSFRYYGHNGTPLNFVGAATYENCLFSGTPTPATGSIFIGYSGGTTTNTGSVIKIVDTVSRSVNTIFTLKLGQ